MPGVMLTKVMLTGAMAKLAKYSADGPAAGHGSSKASHGLQPQSLWRTPTAAASQHACSQGGKAADKSEVMALEDKKGTAMVAFSDLGQILEDEGAANGEQQQMLGHPMLRGAGVAAGGRSKLLTPPPNQRILQVLSRRGLAAANPVANPCCSCRLTQGSARIPSPQPREGFGVLAWIFFLVVAPGILARVTRHGRGADDALTAEVRVCGPNLQFRGAGCCVPAC